MDIQVARESIILAKQSISLAEESVRIAKLRYDNGVGIGLDVLDAQTSMFQSRANLMKTPKFNLNLSKFKLYKAIGMDI